MADIVPFRGVRYNSAVVGDLARVISPPYDVIDARLRKKLLQASPYNIARIIRAEPDLGAEPMEHYRDSAGLFRAWMEDGVLVQDAQPAMYVYEQRFQVDGDEKARTGMVVLTRLEELGKGVLPHERTLSGPKADRLNLLRATRANFGQIFSLYSDPGGDVGQLLARAKFLPTLEDVTDDEGIVHRLWAVTDEATIRAIQQRMAGRPLFIADGHHRYETALNYSHERPDLQSAGYRMMTLVSMADPGLVILPTHRLVKNVPDFAAGTLLEGLKTDFEIAKSERATAAARQEMLRELAARQTQGGHAFGLYMNDGHYYLLTLRNPEATSSVHGVSSAARELDVAILHALILERHLGIDAEALEKETNVEYVKAIGKAVSESVAKIEKAARAGAGAYQALFFMNPTRVDQVQAVASQGEKMPQKSTFFYPKVYTGVVINRLED